MKRVVFNAVISFLGLFLFQNALAQVGDLQIEALSGNGPAPVISDGNGQLIRTHRYAMDISSTDFQAWNFDGTIEENTIHNLSTGLSGSGFHYLVADLDFPISAEIESIVLYGVDTHPSKALRLRIYQQNRIDPQSPLVIFEHANIFMDQSGSDLFKEALIEVDLDFPLRMDNTFSRYFIEIMPVNDQDPFGLNFTNWEGDDLSVRTVTLFYKYN